MLKEVGGSLAIHKGSIEEEEEFSLPRRYTREFHVQACFLNKIIMLPPGRNAKRLALAFGRVFGQRSTDRQTKRNPKRSLPIKSSLLSSTDKAKMLSGRSLRLVLYLFALSWAQVWGLEYIYFILPDCSGSFTNFAIYAGQKCQTWCASNKNNWFAKCKWTFCSACPECPSSGE